MRSRAEVVYAFADCDSEFGLARVPLDEGSARVIVRDACGDVAALLDDSISRSAVARVAVSADSWGVGRTK